MKINSDSSLYKFIFKLLDVLWLNLLWLVTSIPLITIGAATTAAFSVSLNMVDDEEGYITRTFFKEFKSNFKKGTIIWILQAVCLYALYLDYQFITKSDSPSLVLIFLSILSLLFVFFCFLYVYALNARYENKIINHFKNSLSISFRYPGKTIILLITTAIEVIIFDWNTTMQFFGIILGPMILIYTISGIAKRIFQDIDKKWNNGTYSDNEKK